MLLFAILSASMIMVTGCGEKLDLSSVVSNLKGSGEEDSGHENEQPDNEQSAAPSSADDTDPIEAPEASDQEDDTEPVAASADILLHPYITTHATSYSLPDSYRTYLTYSYDRVAVSDEDAVRYPRLAQALESFYQEREADALYEIEELKEEAISFMENQSDDYYYRFYSSYTAAVQRSDSSLISILHEFDSYTGGAHGYSGKSGYSFDTETGEIITPDIAFTDVKAAADAISDELNCNYESGDFYDGCPTGDEIMEYITDGYLNFWFDSKGINVVFNPYEIGSYASGEFRICLDYRVYGAIMNEKYITLPENYICRIDTDDRLLLDLEDDGELHEVFFRALQSYDEYGNVLVDHIDIGVDEHSERIDISSYYYTPYLVKNDGRYYIYAQSCWDNDINSIFVFALNEDGVTRQGGEYGTGLAVATGDPVWEEGDDRYDNTYTTYVLTDPKKMLLEKRTDMLSTVSGQNLFLVGEEGVPEVVSGEEIYYFTYIIPLTLKQDVTGIETESGIAYTIKAGTVVDYIGTDNETFVLLSLEDGTVIRLAADNSDWPRTVDGIDAGEIFEGMIFAG